jgi:proline iminopeptidase
MTASVTDPLAEGPHTFDVDGHTLAYHVHGAGPVCVAHSGGPGINWGYMRAPELEKHLTMVYLEPIGTGASDRLATHPHGYTRAVYSAHVAALIEHLGVPRVHLLGHSHGGFVAQYHAVYHPEQLAGIVLYDSAPVTGEEFGAEIGRALGEATARHNGKPGFEETMAAFARIPTIADDEAQASVARGIVPLYLADFWADEERWTRMQSAIEATYISGLDENGVPDQVDDREVLAAVDVPALVVAGRFDPICGVHWAEELHKLIEDSTLLILESSGHFGHLEEPELFAREVVAFVASGTEGSQRS